MNGAGKSTLMNILGGVTQPDKGKIFIDEEEIAIPSPKEAARHGISSSSTRSRNSSLPRPWPLENIFISHLFTNPRFPFIVERKKAANREARRHLETLGIAHRAKRQRWARSR